jgi:hypothetical protein
MAGLPRIRTLTTLTTLTVDRTGALRPMVFAALAAFGVAVTLGLAWIGGRLAVAGIVAVEAAMLVWTAGRR